MITDMRTSLLPVSLGRAVIAPPSGLVGNTCRLNRKHAHFVFIRLVSFMYGTMVWTNKNIFFIFVATNYNNILHFNGLFFLLLWSEFNKTYRQITNLEVFTSSLSILNICESASLDVYIAMDVLYVPSKR